jgi:hypothetical protein
MTDVYLNVPNLPSDHFTAACRGQQQQADLAVTSFAQAAAQQGDEWAYRGPNLAIACPSRDEFFVHRGTSKDLLERILAAKARAPE